MILQFKDESQESQVPHYFIPRRCNPPRGLWDLLSAILPSQQLIEALPAGDVERDALMARVVALRVRYDGLSGVYQASKANTTRIPLS